MDEHVAQLEARCDEVRRWLTPNLDTAGELRQTRAWERHKQEFANEGGGKPAYAAREALLNAPADERGVRLRGRPPTSNHAGCQAHLSATERSRSRLS